LPTLSISDRLKIALGGFVAFTGFIVMVIVILTATGSTEIKSVLQSDVMIGAVAFLGFLDVFCGILLLLGEKKVRWSFTTQKKKTDNQID